MGSTNHLKEMEESMADSTLRHNMGQKPYTESFVCSSERLTGHRAPAVLGGEAERQNGRPPRLQGGSTTRELMRKVECEGGKWRLVFVLRILSRQMGMPSGQTIPAS